MNSFEHFTPDGHLTDEALLELISGEPDELTRLEIAEHLSFCDACTERYTALLCDDTLLTPPQPMAEGVLAKIRRQARTIFFHRYVAAGLAAGFALVFWATGVFRIESFERELPRLNNFTNLERRLSQRTDDLNQRFNDAIDQLLSQFDWKGANPNEKK